ncbi:MAG: S-layer homology domain-containing protein [Clostridiales bacterium]|nr:S-layer homology domain-containing protein [Clostridiales bacterium]
MRKKLLALLLSLVCVLTLVGAPAAARAVEEPAATAAPTAEPTEEPTPTPVPEPTPEPSAEPEPEPTPTPEPTPEPTPAGPWYTEAMAFAVDNHILVGDEYGNLNPEKNATRAEMATMLVRIFACTQGKSLAHFPDVNQQLWYVDALSVAAEMGIFKGDTGGTMRPNDPITRQEAFAVLSRAFALISGDPASLDRFADSASVSDWARAEIAGMVEAGFLQGYDGRLHPQAWITRAEIAQVFLNLGLTFCSEPEELPETGLAVYNGTAPLALEGFSGTVYLGGGCGGSVTLTGDAPEANVIVRTDPGVTVELDAAVASVQLYARNGTLTGTGSAERVRLCALGCAANVSYSALESDYDAGLAGVTTIQTDPVPALTPENRTVYLYITYCDVDLTGAQGDTRTCTVRWYIDGVQQPLRTIELKHASTPEFSVSESVWQRTMPGSHTVKVELLYGTDVVTTEFTVPVQNYTDAEYAKLLSTAKPYRLEVVRNQCTVLVYGLDKSGNYSILYHAFVCGPGNSTPLGTFQTPYKARWNPLMGGTYGQYVTQITGNYLFHSVPYNSMHENDLCYKLYNQLGTICSHGCVRLTCADAKWIYDNCPIGTTVRIYDSSTLPVPKPKAPWLDITSPYRGWDPTDPNPNNPWKK